MSFRKKLKAWRGALISVLVFALLIGGAVSLLGGLERGTGEAQARLVREAVRRAALTCFAVEGRYPQTAAYLEAHYGLMYDHSRYALRYDAFSSNIMPDIRVMSLGAENV